ncbi:hypothetical protein GYB29_11585 [bacterium]|nr:hypothetical protein [bacterium]
MNLKNEIQRFLDIEIHSNPVPFEILETEKFEEFDRQLISYMGSEKDEIRAYLFIPTKKKIIGSILVHHQHNGERHLGKSEVARIAGDEFQNFCPALAKKGFVTLAPDSICFEDRRKNMKGISEDPDPDNDVLQHYNELCYRILGGSSLMKKVIEDSSIAISLLSNHDLTKDLTIGILGHSYGGNTVIFHSPFDERIQLSCSSGAVCSYKTKFEHDTGIEMAEVIPGFTQKYDVEDLLKMINPRKLLILSAESDQYARDAKEIYREIRSDFDDPNAIVLKHYEGGHPLDQQRFDDIIDWFRQEFENIP